MAVGPSRRYQVQRPVSFSYTVSNGMDEVSSPTFKSSPLMTRRLLRQQHLPPSPTGRTAFQFTANELLTGFSDADGDTLSIEAVTTYWGELSYDESATYTYTPDANYNGTDTLDSVVLTAMAATPWPPLRSTSPPSMTHPSHLRHCSSNLRRSVALIGQLLATDVDANETLTYSFSGANPIDGLTIEQTGAWSFDPSVGPTTPSSKTKLQTITVDYTVTDSTGDTGTKNSASTRSNDAPVAASLTTPLRQQKTALSSQVNSPRPTLMPMKPSPINSSAPIAGLTINTDGSWSADPANTAYQSLA